MDEEGDWFSNSKSSASVCCLALAWFFCQFQSGVAYKNVAYQKACIYSINREMLEMLGTSMKNTSQGVSKLRRKNCARTLYLNYRASFSHLLRAVPTRSAVLRKCHRRYNFNWFCPVKLLFFWMQHMSFQKWHMLWKIFRKRLFGKLFI